jgi:hypothetical protein
MLLLMLIALHAQVLPCDASEDKWSSTDAFLDLIIDAKADPSTAEPERGEDALDSLLQSIPDKRPGPVSATAGLTGAVSEFSCELLLAAESGPPGTEMRLLLPVSSGLFYTLPCLNGSPFLPAGTGSDRPCISFICWLAPSTQAIRARNNDLTDVTCVDAYQQVA